jgi:hypothetical protein
MNREDIIKLAREANIKQAIETPHLLFVHELERFAAFVAAAEREACAELVMQGTNEPVQTKTLEVLRKERERIAEAIRARGEP